MQIEELASGMGHAADFHDALGKTGFIASVIITDEAPCPVPEELPGMGTGAAFGAVVDHGMQTLEGSRSKGPEIGGVGRLGTRLETLHLRLAGMTHVVTKHTALYDNTGTVQE